jgi:hypothetical protein
VARCAPSNEKCSNDNFPMDKHISPDDPPRAAPAKLSGAESSVVPQLLGVMRSPVR